MRESFGGAMLFWIIFFFLSIFIVFIGSIIRYARVYKIKNSMINYIERNEGVTTEEEFENQLRSLGYNNGYKLCKYYPTELGGFYYLELYAIFELPVVGNMINIGVTIKGETRLIDTGTQIRANGDSWLGTSEERCVSS